MSLSVQCKAFDDTLSKENAIDQEWESIRSLMTDQHETMVAIANDLKKIAIQLEELEKACRECMSKSNQSEETVGNVSNEITIHARQITVKMKSADTECAEEELSEVSSLIQATCNSCNAPNRLITNENGISEYLLKRCSGCLKALYCSKECQLKNWSCHKVECLS